MLTTDPVLVETWTFLRRRLHHASSFAVMRRRRVRESLAFDGDFDAAGSVEVRPT